MMLPLSSTQRFPQRHCPVRRTAPLQIAAPHTVQLQFLGAGNAADNGLRLQHDALRFLLADEAQDLGRLLISALGLIQIAEGSGNFPRRAAASNRRRHI
jgi:hypothetical protein